MSEEQEEPTREEQQEAYDAAFQVQKEFDHDRGELLSVALSVYCAYASSPSPTTMQNALRTARDLLAKVNDRSGPRPTVPPYPKGY